MNPTETLHYAMGEIAYAMAKIDGNVQREEQKQLHAILAGELGNPAGGVDLPGIIFNLLEKDRQDPESAYEWAMQNIRLYSHYLSPGLKLAFLRVAEKVTAAFPPVTLREKTLLHRFRDDIAALQGDPVYYSR